MKIILLEEVESLGLPGDVIEVARGYAQNYLIPTKQAVIASKGQLHDLQKQLEAKRKKAKIERASAEELVEIVAAKTLLVTGKAGVAGKLYGSVTAADLAEAFKVQFGLDIDKKKFKLDEAIKTLGAFKVKIKLHPGIEATLAVEVSDEEGNIPEVPKEQPETTEPVVEEGPVLQPIEQEEAPLDEGGQETGDDESPEQAQDEEAEQS